MQPGIKFKIWPITLCLLFIPFHFTFAERNMQIDAVIGIGIPSNSNFDDSTVHGVAFTYAIPSVNLRAGYLELGDFTLDNGSFDNRLEIVGAYLELIKVIRLNGINLEVGAGVAATNTEMFLDGEQINSESDTSPFAEIILAKHLSELITLHAGVAWFSDVSGSDITVPKAGIRFSF